MRNALWVRQIFGQILSCSWRLVQPRRVTKLKIHNVKFIVSPGKSLKSKTRHLVANDSSFYIQQLIPVQGFYVLVISFRHTLLTTVHLISRGSSTSQFHQITSAPAPFSELITSLPDIAETLSDYAAWAAAEFRAASTISWGHICDNLFSSSQTLFLQTNSLTGALRNWVISTTK